MNRVTKKVVVGFFEITSTPFFSSEVFSNIIEMASGLCAFR